MIVILGLQILEIIIGYRQTYLIQRGFIGLYLNVLHAHESN